MKRNFMLKKIIFSGLLFTTALNISTAGVKFINNTSKWVAVRVTFDNNQEKAMFLPPKYNDQADGLLAGPKTIDYMVCGEFYTADVNLPGAEGWRDYTLHESNMAALVLGKGTGIFDKPGWTINTRRNAASCCISCKPCDSCCPACPVCPKFTIG